MFLLSFAITAERNAMFTTGRTKDGMNHAASPDATVLLLYIFCEKINLTASCLYNGWFN